MPNTALAGDRNRRARNPRDLTGRKYVRLAAEQQEKQEAADLDVAEIRRQALAQGIDAGYDAGFTAGWEAALQQLREVGLDVDAVMALDDDEPGEDA